MTQNDTLLKLLKERGSQGVNSFEPFRNNHRQLPRMVNDLRRAKHAIISVNQKNTSVTYVLVSSPRVKLDIKPIIHPYFMKNVGGFHAGEQPNCDICNPKPEQLSI